MRGAAVLARGQFRSEHAKTAHGLIIHGQEYRVVAVIDETCAGRDAGELLGLGHRGIPVVASLGELPEGADVLIVGVAPTGGRLPPEWRRDILEALRRGMEVVSGLHDLLGDDPELASAARKSGVRIQDVRRPPERLELARGARWRVPVVLTCGTDCAVGKRTVTAELHREARRRGIDARLVATGQTGILVGSDAGVVIDHVPGDFMSGTVEALVRRMERSGAELVFVQGQASLTHLAYAPVTLGILYGARPHFIVLVHDPERTCRPSFPDQPVLDPMDEAGLVRRLWGGEPVALALNCRRCRDPERTRRLWEKRTGLPTADVLRDGPARLLDGLLLHLSERKDLGLRIGRGLGRAMRRVQGPNGAGAKKRGSRGRKGEDVGRGKGVT